MSELFVHFVSPFGVIYEGEALSITLPSVGGEIGILKDHQPIFAALKSGSVQIKTSKGEKKKFDIESGYFSVNANDVEITVNESIQGANE